MKKIWDWLSGKKTIIGLLIVSLQVDWTKFLESVQDKDPQLAATIGGVIAIIGLIHKMVKK